MATAIIPEGKAFRPQPLLSSIPQGVALKAVPGAQTPSPRSRRGRGESRSYRLKSAFQGAPRQASAFADAKDTFPVGAGFHAD
jgi:hypothetical protein